MRKLLLLLSFCLAAAAAAHAQGVRSLPPKGDRGTLGANQPLPQVQIGSNVLRLAPGAIIYDQNNRTVVHSQLPTDVDVFYTKDQNGEVQRMYILTDQEKARLDQSRTR